MIHAPMVKPLMNELIIKPIYLQCDNSWASGDFFGEVDDWEINGVRIVMGNCVNLYFWISGVSNGEIFNEPMSWCRTFVV